MKRLLIFALIAALFLPMMGQEESRILLGNLMKPKVPSYALNLNQNLLTTSSPTFAGLTLSGSTASTLAYLNASKAFTSLANGSGYLLNDGSGGLSWGALDLSPYVKKDGSTELTADWNVGAFDLTAVDMTATNFKLSGVGTFASTLGNVSLTTSLTAASGNEVGFELPVTVNKAAGNYTAFKINATETSAPGTTDYLMDLGVGGGSYASKFKVSNTGIVTAASYFASGSFYSGYFAGSDYYIYAVSSSGNYPVLIFPGTENRKLGLKNHLSNTDTEGAISNFYISSTYNQASGTAANTDLLINRTETALGSGTQRLISAGTGGKTFVEKFGVDNSGYGYFGGANGQTTNIKQATVVVTTTAAGTATATNLIPAGSMVIGVSTRVTTAVTGDAGFTGINIGDGSDPDRWGANVNPALDETTDLTDCTIISAPIYAAATSVVLTQVGGSTFNAGGVVRITVHYINLTAPST